MTQVKLDRIDRTIIRRLLLDARTNHKDIAKECGVSPNAIFKHVENLKNKGVIVGSTILFEPWFLGERYAAAMEVTLDYGKEIEVLDFLRGNPHVLMCFEGIGRCDVFVLFSANCVNELDMIKEAVKQQGGVKHISISVRVDQFEFLYQNLDLGPEDGE